MGSTSIGDSTIQRITLGHARTMFASDRAEAAFPRAAGLLIQIVAEPTGA